MLEFRDFWPDGDKRFVQEMFLTRAFESAPEAARRGGLNQFRQAWLESPAALALMRRLKATLKDARTIAQVIVVDGNDAGFVWATFDDEPGEETHVELRLVAFLLRFRRQGLGRLTVQHVEEIAAQRDVHVMRSAGNAPSDVVRRFHDSLGFQPTQTVYEKKFGLPVT